MQTFSRKPEGKRPLARPKRRYKNDIKMNFIKLSRDDVDWIFMVQDWNQWRALINMVMNIKVP
jgi:hypothetical protein